MTPDPAVEALIADGTWNASPLGACGVRRMVRGRVAEGLVRLVREADAAALAADREPERVEKALGILRELVEGENAPCSFDHHGYCQEHGWMGDTPGECGVREARQILGLSEPHPEGS